MARRALYVANGDASNVAQPITTNTTAVLLAGKTNPNRASASYNAAASDLIDWQGGHGSLIVSGTLGGATVTLQLQAPDGTWLPVSATTAVTAAGVANFYAPAAPLRVSIAGGAAASISAWVVGIPTNNAG